MSASARLIRRGREPDAPKDGRTPGGAPRVLGSPAPAPGGDPRPGPREGPAPRRLASPRAPLAGSPARVSPSPGAGERVGSLPVALLALFLLAIYTRPQDLLPVLRPLRLTFLLGIGAAAAYAAETVRRGAPLIRPIREVFLVGALLALAVASIPFSLWPGQSAAILLGVVVKIVLAFLLVSHLVDTPERVRLVTGVLVAAGAYLAGGALYAYAIGEFGHYGGRAGGIVGGMFKDPNDLALTLVVMASLAGFQAVASRRAATRVLLAGAVVLMFSGIFVTFSRGGLLALLAAAGVGLLRLARHGRGLAVAGLAGLALAVALLAPEGYSERATSIVTQEEDASIQARLTTLRYGVELVAENPVPGVGLGAFRIAEGAKHSGTGKWNEAHNTFLQVGAELGWAGLAVYVALAACAVANARAAARRAAGNPTLTAAAHGLETAVVGFLAGAMFLSQAYTWHFYILLALTVAQRRIVEANGATTGTDAAADPRSAPARSPAPRVVRAGGCPIEARGEKRAG